MNLKELETRLKELETKKNSFEFPLTMIQRNKYDEVVNEIKKVKFNIFILKHQK